MKLFKEFFLGRDILGHSISINYRGNTSYNTYLGALLTIGVQMLVLVQLVQKSIDLYSMEDPNVTIMSRPIYEEESSQVYNFKDHKFDVGVAIVPPD